ncbi:MAG TPA: hypothetical protein VFA32_03740 [Dehalococcoidia bacterium]|jgi:hypothetical protein|nr:hypothetical protein [Dehalococcoidia bacterium]
MTTVEKLAESLIPVKSYCEATGMTTEWVRKKLRQGRLRGIRLGHMWYVIADEEPDREKPSTK